MAKQQHHTPSVRRLLKGHDSQCTTRRKGLVTMAVVAKVLRKCLPDVREIDPPMIHQITNELNAELRSVDKAQFYTREDMADHTPHDWAPEDITDPKSKENVLISESPE